jgi:hypothetical protein
MKKILTVLFLACGIAAMPVVYAADEASADKKTDQKAAGEDKDKKAPEDSKKKGEKKGGGGAEPECN